MPIQSKLKAPILALGVWLGVHGGALLAADAGNSDTALDLYSRLSGLIVLRAPRLPELPESILAKVPEQTNEAIGFIEAELMNNKMELLRTEPGFVVVMVSNPTDAFVRSWVARLHVTHTPGEELVPAGAIYFRNVDASDALKIYSALRRRTALHGPALPGAFTFRNQRPLQLSEAIYAFEVLMALQGVGIVDDGARFVQAVPLVQASLVRAHSPKPGKEDKLIDYRKVPKFERTVSPRTAPPRATTWASGVSRVYQKLRTKLFPPPAPPRPIFRDLAEYYGKLSGAKFVTSRFDNNPITFSIQEALTKAELLYAIKTTFELNGFTLAPVGKNSFQVIPYNRWADPPS